MMKRGGEHLFFLDEQRGFARMHAEVRLKPDTTPEGTPPWRPAEAGHYN
jgi:hypothetical protein